MIIGVLSDTHGFLDPRALGALDTVEHILHAGDIGNPAIIAQLEEIAPVTAVRGNVDRSAALTGAFPLVQELVFESVRVFMTHVGGAPQRLAQHLPVPTPRVYIFGHSHIALCEEYAGVLFLNPGAAGKPRFGGGLSVARLAIEHDQVAAKIIPLR